MESRSYMFSTAKKRSTLLENKLITFSRDDDNSPRTKILKKECTSEFGAFKECMGKFNDEAKCGNFKDALVVCGVDAFKKANSFPGYTFE